MVIGLFYEKLANHKPQLIQNTKAVEPLALQYR